jgi:DNA repair exonuclease SbcCD ATPase subunit
MSDLQSKLTALQAQLAEARTELEAAQAKARETENLKAKLEALTRVRAVQDLVSSLEAEIAAVTAAIAQAEREQHRAALLEEARALAGEVGECQAALESLVTAVAEAVARLHQQAPSIVARWRGARERWLALFAALEPGSWPHSGKDVENSRRLEALRRVVDELGPEGRALLRLPPGTYPTNRLERPAHEGRNWQDTRPSTPEDVAAYVLDTTIRR